MKLEIQAVYLLLLFTGSSQSEDHDVLFPPPAGDSTLEPLNQLQPQTQATTGRDKDSAEATPPHQQNGTRRSGDFLNAVQVNTSVSVGTATPPPSSTIISSTLPDDLSSPWIPLKPPLQPAISTRLSQSPHTVQSGDSSAPTSAPSTTPDTTPSLTAASSRTPAGAKHEEVPSELNVGDEELKGSRRRPSNRLDPLLAALLSVFIVTTAIVFSILFFKFRQQTDHPEFHRLQDLPMDDLMEDTPLSRYTH